MLDRILIHGLVRLCIDLQLPEIISQRQYPTLGIFHLKNDGLVTKKSHTFTTLLPAGLRPTCGTVAPRS